jgi:hypothetical protein
VTPVLVLVDALEATGDLAYLDWKAGPVDVATALAGLPLVRRARVDLDAIAALEDWEAEAAIAGANSLLKPHDLVAVILDEDSDALPLAVIPMSDRSDVRTFAKRAGATVRVPRARKLPGASAPESHGTSPGHTLRDPRASGENYERSAAHLERKIPSTCVYMAKAYIDDRPEMAFHVMHALSQMWARFRCRYALGRPMQEIVEDAGAIGMTWINLNTMAGPRWHESAWSTSVIPFTKNARNALDLVQLMSVLIAVDKSIDASTLLIPHVVQQAKLPIVGHLTRMVGEDAPIDGPPSHAKLWQPWIDVVESAPEDRQAAFETFVRGYAKGLRSVGCYSSPKSQGGYCGQFAFEAVPLALHYGLDDSMFRDEIDYPTDLADYGRALRAEEAALRERVAARDS